MKNSKQEKRKKQKKMKKEIKKKQQQKRSSFHDGLISNNRKKSCELVNRPSPCWVSFSDLVVGIARAIPSRFHFYRQQPHSKPSPYLRSHPIHLVGKREIKIRHARLKIALSSCAYQRLKVSPVFPATPSCRRPPPWQCRRPPPWRCRRHTKRSKLYSKNLVKLRIVWLFKNNIVLT